MPYAQPHVVRSLVGILLSPVRLGGFVSHPSFLANLTDAEIGDDDELVKQRGPRWPPLLWC